MRLSDERIEGGPVRLLPHQSSFVEAVLGDAGTRVTLLRADVGLGKSTALVAVASRLLQEQPAARSLFVVPAPLRQQFVDRLRKSGTPALLVDRYRFRELVDATRDGDYWPSGVVAVVGQEFARQPDVLESLASTQWDLVIADEAHWLVSGRAELLRRVAPVAKRVVLATASRFPSFGVLELVSTVVDWPRDQLVDLDGRLLDVVPRPSLHEVSFSVSPAEKALQEAVHELCRVLEAGTHQQVLVGEFLLRSLRSSPAVLEARLQRLVVPSEMGDDTGTGVGTTDDEEHAEEDGPAGAIDNPTAEMLSAVADRALQQLGAIKIDSKAVALGELLSFIRDTNEPPPRICVLTDSLPTCFYLAAELEGGGVAYQILHEGMDSNDRLRAVTVFSKTSEILLATSAALQGIELSDVTDLVLYDVPSKPGALQQVLGHFDRIGRPSQLTVHTLVSQNGADTGCVQSLELLRDVIAARGEPFAS